MTIQGCSDGSPKKRRLNLTPTTTSLSPSSSSSLSSKDPLSYDANDDVT